MQVGGARARRGLRIDVGGDMAMAGLRRKPSRAYGWRGGRGGGRGGGARSRGLVQRTRVDVLESSQHLAVDRRGVDDHTVSWPVGLG